MEEEAIITCACGKHTHPLNQAKDCEECQEIQKEYKNAMKILDFYADWCQPCKQMEPTIKGLIADGFDVTKIDIDADTDTAQKYGVMSIPTLVIELDGKEVKRFTGVTTASDIKQAMGL